jgi:hypothetical protein
MVYPMLTTRWFIAQSGGNEKPWDYKGWIFVLQEAFLVHPRTWPLPRPQKAPRMAEVDDPKYVGVLAGSAEAVGSSWRGGLGYAVYSLTRRSQQIMRLELAAADAFHNTAYRGPWRSDKPRACSITWGCPKNSDLGLSKKCWACPKNSALSESAQTANSKVTRA